MWFERAQSEERLGVLYNCVIKICLLVISKFWEHEVILSLQKISCYIILLSISVTSILHSINA